MKNLKLEHDVGLNDQIKVALLTPMVPGDQQDYIFQWTEASITFETSRDRVKSSAMDIGRVGFDEWQKVKAEKKSGMQKQRWRWATSATVVDVIGVVELAILPVSVGRLREKKRRFRQSQRQGGRKR